MTVLMKPPVKGRVGDRFLLAEGFLSQAAGQVLFDQREHLLGACGELGSASHTFPPDF